MGKTVRHLRGEGQRNIIKLLNTLEARHTRWQLWQDFIVMSAISISNLVDAAHREKREEMYLTIAKKYSEKEMAVFPEMLSEVVKSMEENPDQDFLGELFMALELGNDWKGQFFTPYSVCRAMAAMTLGGDGLKEKLNREHWISVNDPACGAGALLVAFANECRRPGNDINFQSSVLFVAQDIDFLAGCMCYIQLSLMGCPGYVVIGDTLCNPSTSYDSRGLIPKDDGNVWYTPFYFRHEWHWRRIAAQMDMLCRTAVPLVEAEEPHPEPPRLVEQPLAETETGQLTLF
ncbi:MAG: SAM-dependent DNA methyltransferase [Oscillospiraceae bacterium]|nr:SAM-dependent DNA methyltransferase [Oscillospiraceae bacterium]